MASPSPTVAHRNRCGKRANRTVTSLQAVRRHAVTDAGVYPAGFQAGYVKQNIGKQLSTSVLFTALKAMWDGTGAYRADPSELILSAQEAVNLQNDILRTGGSAQNSYQFMVTQDEVGRLTGGGAISQYINPITRSMIRLLVHPWLTQGTALLMSYTMPQPWSNISNIWSNVMVQDYLSVAWPVIDATFRYSLFYFGTLFCQAPQYNGLLQGLQVSDSAPFQ